MEGKPNERRDSTKMNQWRRGTGHGAFYKAQQGRGEETKKVKVCANSTDSRHLVYPPLFLATIQPFSNFFPFSTPPLSPSLSLPLSLFLSLSLSLWLFTRKSRILRNRQVSVIKRFLRLRFCSLLSLSARFRSIILGRCRIFIVIRSYCLFPLEEFSMAAIQYAELWKSSLVCDFFFLLIFFFFFVRNVAPYRLFRRYPK